MNYSRLFQHQPAFALKNVKIMSYNNNTTIFIKKLYINQYLYKIFMKLKNFIVFMFN